MKKIVLVGNPNVGKSLLFSRITGIGVVTANYAGTTVGLKIGRFQFKNNEYEIIDGPGLYSLANLSKSDETALKLIEESDIIINVVDSTNLERNLNLTLQLIKLKKPMILCLNFWEDTEHMGIDIDADELEKILDIPVIKTSALGGEGVFELVSALESPRVGKFIPYSSCEKESNLCGKSCSGECGTCNYWNYVGFIISNVQSLKHRHHTLLERFSDFTLHPIGGLVTAIFVLLSTLLIVREMGENATTYVLEPFYSKIYAPFVIDLVKFIPFGFVKGLLVGYSVDPLASFGILTSGVYISLVLVFPYFFSFYLVFGFLEDFGYLPRLAVVSDNFFHRLGLHGYSSIPVMLGLGCKVPAFMATRALTSQREKILTTALILMSAPCLPQSAMIISLGMGYGVWIVLEIFGILIIISILINIILNKVLKGSSTDLFTEIPSYRIPSVKLMGEKLRIRIVDYFSEVFPLIVIGVLIMNILDFSGGIDFIIKTLREPVRILLGLPPDIASVMLLGFLRKDVSIALLAPLNLSANQFVVASIFLVLYIPCISSFFTLIKELGTKSALKIIGVVFTSAVAVTFLLHILFRTVS